MNYNLLKPIVFFAFLVLGSSELSAWGLTGHRVVAEIAENNLNGRAKRKLKKIIGKQKLAYWANWADNVRDDAEWKHTGPWHYVNVPPQTSKEIFIHLLKNNPNESIYSTIKTLQQKIKDKKTSTRDKEMHLRFLIHFVGDMMQPMHTGRAEDLGGNLIKIKFFNRNTNLHSLWDSGLIDNAKYSYTEYARILDVKSPQEKKHIQSGNLEDWFYDSHIISNQLYNSVKEGENYSYNYQQQYNPILERQLLYSGLRLAKILNETL